MCNFQPPLVRATVKIAALILWLGELHGVGSAAPPPASGLHDVVVYDSGAHDRGLPAVEFVPNPAGMAVEIPPAVHVHRYYYSGDKEIQGPIIQGGPTIVVAKHPKTGEQMYVDVVLPAGAPRIAYDGTSITYVYPDERVCIRFQHFPHDSNRAVVKYHSGQGVGRALNAWEKRVATRNRERASQSELLQSLKEAKAGSGRVLQGALHGTGTVATRLVDGAKTVVGAVPGVTPLSSLAEQKAERQRAAEVRQADLQQQQQESAFVPTNR